MEIATLYYVSFDEQNRLVLHIYRATVHPVSKVHVFERPATEHGYTALKQEDLAHEGFGTSAFEALMLALDDIDRQIERGKDKLREQIERFEQVAGQVRHIAGVQTA